MTLNPYVTELLSFLVILPAGLLCYLPMKDFFFYQWSVDAHISKSLAVFCAVMSLMSILSNFAFCFDASRHSEPGADSFTADYALLHLGLGGSAEFSHEGKEFSVLFKLIVNDKNNLSFTIKRPILRSPCM